MWAIWFSAAALAVTIYQLFTRDSTTATEAPAASTLQPTAARTAATMVALHELPATAQDAATRRAIACGVQAGDLGMTQTWTAKSFGMSLPLTQRLLLMRSAYPYDFWPDFAKRIDCTLRGA